MGLLRVLAAGLLLAPAAVHAAPAPKKGPAWTAAKADAQRWREKLMEGIKKSGQYDAANFETVLGKAWKMADNIEKTEKLLHAKRCKAVPAQKKLSKDILETNLLYVYGNVLPRILDESTELAPGRAYAGGDLKLAIGEKEFRAKEAEQRVGAEFPEKLMPMMPE